MWEVLAFFGRFDVEVLRQALHAEQSDDDAEPAAPDLDSQQRRRQLHDEAEAKSRYNEGRRLARLRGQLGAQAVVTLTKKQLEGYLNIRALILHYLMQEHI